MLDKFGKLGEYNRFVNLAEQDTLFMCTTGADLKETKEFNIKILGNVLWRIDTSKQYLPPEVLL